MLESDPGKYEFYEEGSWDLWERTIIAAENGMLGFDDRNAYLPSPLEIKQRIEDIRWLTSRGFSRRFVCAVMTHESPGLDLVKTTVFKYGLDGAIKKLTPFLAKTEYDVLKDSPPDASASEETGTL